MFLNRHTCHSLSVLLCLPSNGDPLQLPTLSSSMYRSILGGKSEFECSPLTRHSEDTFYIQKCLFSHRGRPCDLVAGPPAPRSWQPLLVRGGLVRSSRRPAGVRRCSAAAGGSSARAPSGPLACTAPQASASQNPHSRRYNPGSSGSARID